MRAWSGLLGLVLALGCSSESDTDQRGSGGSSGTSGAAGTAGTAGASGSTATGGASGAGGSAGTGASGGSAGSAAAGSAGAAGSSASGGTAGSAAAGGSAGTSGTGGTAGAGGTGGTAGSSGAGGTAGSGATSGSGGTGASSGSGGTGGTTPLGPVAQCFAGQYVTPQTDGPDYDQFNPTVGSHCKGTNIQNITKPDKVVFLGDSITVGTPPTDLNPAAVYRAILAQNLAGHFGLAAPGLGWGGADVLNGVALPKESGDFISCSKWGARTDDLMKDNSQVVDCIPADKRNLHYLVIITDGGNDVAAFTQDGGGANPAKTLPELWNDVHDFVQNLRDAITWMKDPANVPGGVDVVFGNLYEFTDGTGDVAACGTSGVAGIEPWNDIQAQKDMVIWANEQYLKIAVDTHSDMIFMLESFCGHGYKRDDPTSPCYRGPGQPLWFDLTCIHPNAAGHTALADLFYQTISE